eukprot:343976_1
MSQSFSHDCFPQSERTNLIVQSQNVLISKSHFESIQTQNILPSDEKTEPEESKSFHSNLNEHIVVQTFDADINQETKEQKMDFDYTNIIISAEYIQPRPDDYIKCKGDIKVCDAVVRIIHLLKYCKNMEKMLSNKSSIFQLYAYISTLKNYGVPMRALELFGGHFEDLICELLLCVQSDT